MIKGSAQQLLFEDSYKVQQLLIEDSNKFLSILHLLLRVWGFCAVFLLCSFF